MADIFISYRREDTRADAGRLYDRLSEHFGDNHVFMDIEDIESIHRSYDVGASDIISKPINHFPLASAASKPPGCPTGGPTSGAVKAAIRSRVGTKSQPRPITSGSRCNSK